MFYLIFTLLIIAELIKGLSANGTPPVLQKFSWQLDLARFMWTKILFIRIVLVAALVFSVYSMPAESRSSIIAGGVILCLLWAFIYWLFNRYWVGRFKFLPLTNPVFSPAGENQVDVSVPVLGVNLNGEQKAYPTAMIFYHHHLPDVPHFHSPVNRCRCQEWLQR